MQNTANYRVGFSPPRFVETKRMGEGHPHARSIAAHFPVQIRQLRARQRRVIHRQIIDIGIRQRPGESRHDRILALARLVLVQRLRDVVAILTREARVLRIDARVAVRAVAGLARRGFRLAGVGIAFGEGRGRSHAKRECQRREDTKRHLGLPVRFGHWAGARLERYVAMSLMSWSDSLPPWARIVGCARSLFFYSVGGATM